MDSHLCILELALYAVKEAPHDWYTMINSYVTRLGFTKGDVDENIYHILVVRKCIIFFFIYVDDFIIIGDERLIRSCKEDLAMEFEMKDLGLIHHILRLET